MDRITNKQNPRICRHCQWFQKAACIPKECGREYNLYQPKEGEIR